MYFSHTHWRISPSTSSILKPFQYFAILTWKNWNISIHCFLKRLILSWTCFRLFFLTETCFRLTFSILYDVCNFFLYTNKKHLRILTFNFYKIQAIFNQLNCKFVLVVFAHEQCCHKNFEVILIKKFNAK